MVSPFGAPERIQKLAAELIPAWPVSLAIHEPRAGCVFKGEIHAGQLLSSVPLIILGYPLVLVKPVFRILVGIAVEAHWR